jgi:hypothetical protein
MDAREKLRALGFVLTVLRMFRRGFGQARLRVTGHPIEQETADGHRPDEPPRRLARPSDEAAQGSCGVQLLTLNSVIAWLDRAIQ